MANYRKEEDKIMNHEKIQCIASQFWKLLNKNEIGRIQKDEYVKVSETN